MPDNYVYTLLSDGSEGVWVGTVKGLAHLLSNGSWTIYNKENSNLPYNYVYSLVSDGSGGIWIRIFAGLAHLASDNSLTIYYEASDLSLPDIEIHPLLSDGNGGVWVGAKGELGHLSSDNSWTVYNTENSRLTDNIVLSLLLDGNGGIWIGTDGGLFHLAFDSTNVDIDLNQSEYKVGDSFKLNVNLNTDHYSVDLYVILAYLNGYFQSVVSTQCFSRVNHAVPYHKNIGGAEAQTFSVLDEVLTVGHPSGEYAYYGIAVKTGTDPLDVKNWLDFDWKNYTLR